MNAKPVRRWSLPKKRVLRRLLQHDPSQDYFVYVPSSGGQNAPICVCVHGLSRNPTRKLKMLSEYAEKYGVVLVAPHLGAKQYPDFQRLGRVGRGERADLAVNAIVEEATWLTGAASAQVYLFGHSAGAQFVHRYMMAHPHRVAAAALAGSGWYTFPDPKRRFPHGIRATKQLPDVHFDPEEFLRVPVTVLVGENDTKSENLRHSARLDAQQGVTRVERAGRWVDAMQKAALSYGIEPSFSLRTIPGAGHSFADGVRQYGLGEIVFQELFGSLDPGRSNGNRPVLEPRQSGAAQP